MPPGSFLNIYRRSFNRTSSLASFCTPFAKLMWLTGRLSPDFKTITGFHRNNGKAIRNVCSQLPAVAKDDYDSGLRSRQTRLLVSERIPVRIVI
jgi:hypothetical protein